MLVPSSGGIYAITDCLNLSNHQLIEKSESILRNGAMLFQYRNKNYNVVNNIELVKELKSLCKQFSVPFIINDDVELARQVAADGIHLGKNDRDLPSTREYLGSVIIGVSCYNNIKRAIEAKKSGVDYIAFGSFFPSQTKPDAVKADVEILTQAKNELDLPIVAIGGITPENGKVLLDAGADFLAVINGLYSVIDTETAVKQYKNLFN